MKIIGATGPSTYLVEITSGELSAIAGQSVDPPGCRNALNPGAVIDVQQASRDLRSFRAAKAQLEAAAATLRAVADLADRASASYIIPPPEPKQPTEPTNPQ